jgi:ribokinase
VRVAVVGHLEWVWFGAVDHIPGPGEIAHATEEWELPGGGGAVAAVQLARLAGSCALFTSVGDDDLGARSSHELGTLGVIVHAAVRADTPTRRAFSQVGPDGERTITTLGERLATSVHDTLPWELLKGADAVYVTAGDPGAFEAARRARVMVVTTRSLHDLLASNAVPDALVGSARDPAERVEVGALPFTPGLVVRTRGAQGGSFNVDGGPDVTFDAPEIVRAPDADTYGAGDSFAAGLTFGLGARMPVDRAIDFAARCGAAVASTRGPYTATLPPTDD